MRNAAGRLFIERAQAARDGFILTDENAPAIAEICARLEGLPLAIELAAARTRLLSSTAILERLSPLLPLLISAGRDRPARHQTMRAAMAWSYNLLVEDEKALFRHVCVFAGGFTLDAALAIGRQGNANDDGILDRIESLVDKSLLRLETAAGKSRLRILETIREYGWERRAERGELEAARRAHAAYFLAQVERPEREWHGPVEREWLVALEQERQNIRAALRWFIDSGDVTRALWLAAALGQFWLTHGPQSEGRARLSEALALSEASSPGDSSGNERRLARAHALQWLASLARRQSDYPVARRRYEESLAILRQVGNPRYLADTLLHLCNAEIQAGDLVAARRWYVEALPFIRESGDELARGLSLTCLGIISLHEEDYSGARLCLEETVTIFREVKDSYGHSYPSHALGCVALGEGRFAEARAHFREAQAIALEFDDKTLTANLLEAMSALAVACSSPERAVRLAGAASAVREAVGVTIAPGWDRWLAPRFQPARSVLSPEAFARAWDEGQSMTLDQAVAFALEDDTSPENGRG